MHKQQLELFGCKTWEQEDELRVREHVRMSGMLKAWKCFFSSEPNIFSLRDLFCWNHFSECEMLRPAAVNCTVRTRSQLTAFQWAIEASPLWAAYSWVTGSPLCHSCAPLNETNEIHFKKTWTGVRLLPVVDRKSCQDEINTTQRDGTGSTTHVVYAYQPYEGNKLCNPSDSVRPWS